MCLRSSSYTSPKPCKHLADYKLRHAFDGYDSLQNCLKTTPIGRTRVDNHNTKIPRCNFCNGYLGRLYICLMCSSISCSTHILLHTQSKSGHDVAIDIERSELYCCLCCDQVYDPDFDKVVVSEQIKGSCHVAISRNTCSHFDDGDCQCIAHRAFSGSLRSDVTCTICGFTSTTYDPCVDVSLNLDTVNLSAAEKTGLSTLSGCLNLFTRAERLGSDSKLHCQNCQELRDTSKQLSISRLPLVLCLHIKRFEHSLIQKTSRKIDQYLQFPFALDMTPYLSSSIVRSRFGNRIFAFECENSDSSAEYEIFAVIAHSGMLESGHYVTYLHVNNQWYKCDDAWICEVDEGIVRASQCYMLFYVQKLLYHKANKDLSCNASVESR